MAEWTAREIETLQRYYETRPRAFLERRLPDRAWNEVLAHGHSLGLRRPRPWAETWTELPDNCLHVISVDQLLWNLDGLAEREPVRAYRRRTTDRQLFSDEQIAKLRDYIRRYPDAQAIKRGPGAANELSRLASAWGRPLGSVKTTVSMMRKAMRQQQAAE